jgi:hypothetical protein
LLLPFVDGEAASGPFSTAAPSAASSSPPPKQSSGHGHILTLQLPQTENGGVLPGGIMSRRLPAPSILVGVLLAATSVLAQKTLTANEADAHIGERRTVCGKVVGFSSTLWSAGSRGRRIALHFDKHYPEQVFNVVIWESDRAKFGDPETAYSGKSVCVTGKIISSEGVPEVVASEPSQIKAQ